MAVRVRGLEALHLSNGLTSQCISTNSTAAAGQALQAVPVSQALQLPQQIKQVATGGLLLRVRIEPALAAHQTRGVICCKSMQEQQCICGGLFQQRL